MEKTLKMMQSSLCFVRERQISRMEGQKLHQGDGVIGINYNSSVITLNIEILFKNKKKNKQDRDLKHWKPNEKFSFISSSSYTQGKEFICNHSGYIL